MTKSSTEQRVEALASRPVRFITYDTGQNIRARMAGLQTEKFRTDAGTGEEPNWAAEGAKQGNGNGARTQRRERQDALNAERASRKDRT
jgi:hypothetical protein